MGIYDFGPKDEQPSPVDFLRVGVDHRTEEQKVNTDLGIYDPEAPEILTARANADEMINTSGAFIKVYPRTDNADFDKVWEEDPDPTYLTHFEMKAFFKPQTLKTELKKWGIDTSVPTEIVFSHRQLYERLGERMLRTGDVLYLPYNAAAINPTHYKVTNGSPFGNFRYSWLYFTCQAVVLKADTIVRVRDDIQDRPHDDPSSAGFREAY